MHGAEELSHHLWLLRELFEQLMLKLETQSMFLAAGKTRWLPFVALEIDAVAAAIVDVDANRAEAAARLAAEVGCPRDATLEQLAAAASEPWRTTLRQHWPHLVSLQAELEGSVRTNVELARRGEAVTKALAAALDGTSGDVYTPQGSIRPLTVASRRLDRTV